MNEQLRSHVTRIGFQLSLGKTHIAALVLIDAETRQRCRIRMNGGPWNWFATGAHGLIDRGMVIHHPPLPIERQTRAMRERRGKWGHLGGYYEITKAGRLTINLLKEAGIWQEYENALPVAQSEAS